MKKRRKRRFVFHANPAEWKAARSAEHYAFFSQAGKRYWQQAFLDRLFKTIDPENEWGGEGAKGQCHGLTVWWLALMKRRQENMLYGLVKNIVNCPNNQDQNVINEMRFLFKMVFKKQNPLLFSNNTVCYRDLGLLLGGKKQHDYSGEFTKETLAIFFQDRRQDANQFCVGDTGKEDCHSVGVFVRDGQFYFYDSNHSSGVARKFSEVTLLVEAIFKALEINGTPTMEIQMIYAEPRAHKLAPPPPAPPSLMARIYHFFWAANQTKALPSAQPTLRL